QVKLRGHRIELGAVEARLAAQPGVLEAACTVDGQGMRQRLVAYVVVKAGHSLDAVAMRAALADELPPMLVPAAIAAIDALPRTTGGKLDRRRLPAVASVLEATQHAPPATDTERLVAGAIAAVLGQSALPSVEADFFDDLGLDSLTVAMVVSRLRSDAATRAATVRLTYDHRSVRLLSTALDAAPRANARGASPGHAPAAEGVARPIAVTALQAGALAGFLAIGAQATWIPGLGRLASVTSGSVAIDTAILALLAIVAVPACALVTLALAVAVKWIVIGRYRPGRFRAWSWWHLRHWLVLRTAGLVPWGLLETADLAPLALRLLGARIGHGVHIHAGVRITDGGWDLLTVEDAAAIGQDASLRMVDLHAGCLVVAPVTVRRGATVETRAGLSGGAELGEGSILRPLSSLRAGVVHADAVLDGVPAVRIGDAEPLREPLPPAGVAVRLAAAATFGALSILASAVPWALAVLVIGNRWRSPVVVVGAVAAAGVATVALQALLARTLGGAPHVS
ncbi:MAG: AMP-binding enzyme, partial [Planctomycetota bacterium]